MGFDIECIIDIHNYPGEYFCPVCRTLVYPNEALQAQCTHVFCKPCLSHVANNSRACPYDGYLVTEADSKPLVQSDKAYAETIGKVKVRCLYHRSGCTWEGSLADCTSHCSGCSFGNSPVICNRCGVQIVHRQVHEHAQSCPGAYQVQQAPDAVQAVLSSGVTSATGAVNLNQATSQAGVAQKSLPAPLPPGQDSNQKANTNSQAQATVPATAPTADQLYQQQYQQYYQQYAGYGYDPYQQAYSQYYPYQQVAVQQYQQHPPQVLGQPNVPLYGQPAAQVQVQSSSQTISQPQALTQHPTQPQAQLQAVQPQTKSQTQVQPLGAATLNSHVQPSVPASQNQPPVNPQQQSHSTMQSHGHIPLQSHYGLPGPQPQPSIPTLAQPQPQQQHLPQPQSLPQSQSQSQPHPQPQLHSHLQSQLQSQPQPQPQPHPMQPPPQHVLGQYPQPHQPMHHPQPSHLQPQPQILTSQPYPQPQMQPQQHLQPPLRPSQPNQPAAVGAPPNQPAAVGAQPNQLAALGAQPNQPAALGAQPNQPTALGAQPNQPHAFGSQPQFVQSSGHAVSGYQSYLQPQPPIQHPMPAHPSGASFPPNQMHAQVIPQPPLMRPPSQGPITSQQQGQFPQSQVPSMPPAQPQQFHHQNPQLSQPIQQRPVIHSSQQLAQQYVQQPLSYSVQSQLSLQNQLPPQQSQQSQQSQLYFHGPPQMMQQNSNVYPQLQQNASIGPGVQLQNPQSYVGRPSMLNQGVPIQPLSLVQSSSGFGAGGLVKPVQLGQYEHSANQTSANNTQKQLQTAPEQQVLQSVMTSTSGVMLRPGDSVSERGVQFETGLSSHNATDMVVNAPRVDSLELKPKKSEVGMGSNQEITRESADKSRKGESLPREADNELNGIKDGSLQPTGKLSLKEEHTGYSLETSDIKLTNVAKHREIIADTRFEDVETNKNHKTVYDETLPSAAGPVNQQKSAGLSTLQTVPPVGPAQVPGHGVIPVRPQGSGLLPQPRLPLNQNDQFQQAPLLKQPHDVTHSGISGLGSSTSMGRGPVPFGAPQGLSLTALPLGSGDSRGGVMGGPPQNLDGDYMKLSGASERGPFGHTTGLEPNALQMNGGLGFDRSFGSQNERFKALPREHLNHTTKDPTWPQDQGSMPLDRAALHGLNYDAGLTMGSAGGGPTSSVQSAFHPSGGPGMVRHDMEHMTPRSPSREYIGRRAPSFGEGSRLNLPVDPQINPFHENRILPLPGFPRRVENYGPEGLRFGENRVPGSYDHVRRTEQDFPPSHFRRGENSPNHFGAFTGHTPMGELSGPANLPHKHQYGEPFTGNKPSLPHLGEPGFRSSFPFQGFTNDGPHAGDRAHFDNSRKRMHMSMGWCRICRVDCETVEGLDRHSQTREHQNMSMDMVMNIKLQNKKKIRFSSDRAGREFGSKKRNNGPEGRGKKP